MDELADLATMKVLANPLRQRILRHLSTVGEATSTTLAAELGVTTGGTSYNLRVLAEHGFVEEIPGRAKGRERWWRAAELNLRFPPYREQSPAMRAAMDEANELWFAQDLEALARFRATRDTLGPWSDALPFSRGSIQVTLPELRDFFEEYLALLRRYQRPEEEVPADAKTVLTHFVAFPDVTGN
jgi:DNA-binding transcriptional ArsR family regulator